MHSSRSGRPEREGCFPENTQLVRGQCRPPSPARRPSPLDLPPPALCPEPCIPPASPAPSLLLGLAMMLFLLFLDVLSSQANKIKNSSGGCVCHCEEMSAFHGGAARSHQCAPSPSGSCEVRRLSQPPQGNTPLLRRRGAEQTYTVRAKPPSAATATPRVPGGMVGGQKAEPPPPPASVPSRV